MTKGFLTFRMQAGIGMIDAHICLISLKIVSRHLLLPSAIKSSLESSVQLQTKIRVVSRFWRN